MQLSGFALIHKTDNSQKLRWPQIPARVELLDDVGKPLVRVDGAGVGWNDDSYRIDAVTWTVPDHLIGSENVNVERDRRTWAGFKFNTVLFQARPDDIANISGAGILATIAIGKGAKPGDLRWHGGTSDFAWIAADNSLVPMDAQTVVLFGQAAAAHKSAHIFAGRSIKNINPIPADFASDKYWPPVAS